MTQSELNLWFALRDRRMLGFKFSRQVPIGPFVVDFCCRSRKLIIEVDGGQHADETAYDAARTRWLQQRGYKVLRVWNSDVSSNLQGVLEFIRMELEAPSPDSVDLSRTQER